MIARLALLVALACLAVTAGAARPAANAFYGVWTVTDVVGYSDVSDGIPRAKRLLGQTIKITRRHIDFDGQSCSPRSGFTVSEVETAPVLEKQYQINIVDTGLPKRTLYLDSREACGGIFRMDDHRILFGSGGVIVRAVKR